jgi:probable rRNA maturation factor
VTERVALTACVRLPRPLLRMLRDAALAATAGRKALRLSIVVVGDRRMRRLNRDFHAVDETTDVLAFPLETTAPGGVDGEVIVCAPVARREARARGLPFATELTLYVVHGVLHLLGEDDAAPADARRMRRLERATLARLGIALPKSHLAELK